MMRMILIDTHLEVNKLLTLMILVWLKVKMLMIITIDCHVNEVRSSYLSQQN